MIIGVPREVKKEEHRVALTPGGAAELRKDGHSVLVETRAGDGSGFRDEDYSAVAADIVPRETLFGRADLIVKVKEPLPSEYHLFRDGQALFTYLHLAPNRELTEFLLGRNVTAIGYETVRKNGSLPLLTPMSEIAGRMAPLVGSYFLQAVHGGTGMLPPGATGVRPARAVILGAGVVGTNAARISRGLGMDTVVLNRGLDKLHAIDELFNGTVKTGPATSAAVSDEIRGADLIIGAMLVPGGRTPVLITKEMLGTMKKGSVIVDVSIDQGGCAETSRPSTHDDPVYRVDGILHYTVANMPGAYPVTATLALTNATLPYIRLLAGLGIDRALNENAELRSGLNIRNGAIQLKALAEALGIPFK
ncbi:MAG: alanine dehydrogenase [Nitrospirae bacterium]|nr:MAG: alanine dehydrogenase [Nitrospirota bacterium]